jgi:hypothetical protein
VWYHKHDALETPAQDAEEASRAVTQSESPLSLQDEMQVHPLAGGPGVNVGIEDVVVVVVVRVSGTHEPGFGKSVVPVLHHMVGR